MLNGLFQRFTHKLTELPVLVLMPHSRCNCRCVMCDIWKANQEKTEISAETLSTHVDAFRKLGVRRVALSGGEALMHSNLWKFCELLRGIGAKISLLSTGITLKAHATDVVKFCDDVIVSIDGSQEVHNRIRNIPSAFEKLTEGVRALKQLDPTFRVTGRCVLQKLNYRDLPNIIQAALDIGLDQISFLSADVSSAAFNHTHGWEEGQVQQVAPSLAEAEEFEKIIRQSFVDFAREYDRRFVAESREKILRLPQYYRAVAGTGHYPAVQCNAPWVSAVVESNGDLMPCFFHKPYGNIRDGFERVINSPAAISFRQQLDVKTNPVCSRCVCSLNLGRFTAV